MGGPHRSNVSHVRKTVVMVQSRARLVGTESNGGTGLLRRGGLRLLGGATVAASVSDSRRERGSTVAAAQTTGGDGAGPAAWGRHEDVVERPEAGLELPWRLAGYRRSQARESIKSAPPASG